VLSLLASVVANIYSDTVREYLGRRKQIRLSNRKSRELQTYALIKGLVEGDPIAIVRFSYSQSASIYTTVAATLLITMSLLLLSLSNPAFLKPEELDATVRHTVVLVIMLMVAVSGLMFLGGYVMAISNMSRMRKLRRFSEYEADIRKKWGSDAV
jgi:hypothetical protein